MKLVLDWDEDTTDLVIIAIGSYLVEMHETLDRMRQVDSWFRPELSALHKESVRKLSGALNDLVAEEEKEEGIYVVKELLGSHEARLVKEEK